MPTPLRARALSGSRGPACGRSGLVSRMGLVSVMLAALDVADPPRPSWNRPPGFWDTSFRGSSRPEVATSQAPPEASGLSGPLPSHHGAPGALRLLGRMEGERLRGPPAVTLSSGGPGSATSRARHSGGPAMTSAPPSPPCRLVPTRSQRTFRNDFNGGGTHERDAPFWPFRVFA